MKATTGTIRRPVKGYRNSKLGMLLVLPATLIMLCVVVYPLSLNIKMSFQKILMMKPYLGTPFVWFENYQKVLAEPTFWRAAGNSLTWTIGSVSLQVLAGLIISSLLNAPIKARGLFRGVMMIPWITPGVVAALTWKWMYDGEFGILNHILMQLHLIQNPIVWLGTMKTAMPALIVQHAWKNAPFIAVMLLASMQTIPGELYEAASIDGAGGWKKFLHVTLPQIRPTLFLTTLLSTIWTFNSFDTIWLLTEGGPSGATETLTTFVYKATFQAFNLGKAAAIAVLMFIALLGLVVTYAKATSKER